MGAGFASVTVNCTLEGTDDTEIPTNTIILQVNEEHQDDFETAFTTGYVSRQAPDVVQIIANSTTNAQQPSGIMLIDDTHDLTFYDNGG